MADKTPWNPKENEGVIFTAQRESLSMALNEIYQAVPNTAFGQWMGKDAGAVDVPGGFYTLYDALKGKPPIFLRHIFPVQMVIDLEQQGLEDGVAGLIDGLKKEKAFSVQARGEGAREQGKQMSTYIASLGYTQDVRYPEQIISIYIQDGKAYAGLSTPKKNLSIWSGGMNRYSREGNYISRAQFKLVEAFEAFDLRPVRGSRALDLGAAPGGWTMVLLDLGYRVCAVDPAPLDDRLVKRKSLTYVKGTAQHFLRESKGQFELLVNDMIIDARESAVLMNQFAERLSAGGHAIMTVKLPRKETVKRMKSALKLLEREYEIMGVKQLSQNKSEVTCLMKKK